jgi:hypothetical protein
MSPNESNASRKNRPPTQWRQAVLLVVVATLIVVVLVAVFGRALGAEVGLVPKSVGSVLLSLVVLLNLYNATKRRPPPK